MLVLPHTKIKATFHSYFLWHTGPLSDIWWLTNRSGSLLQGTTLSPCMSAWTQAAGVHDCGHAHMLTSSLKNHYGMCTLPCRAPVPCSASILHFKVTWGDCHCPCCTFPMQTTWSDMITAGSNSISGMPPCSASAWLCNAVHCSLQTGLVCTSS